MKVREITRCRACESDLLCDVMNLGNLAVSDFVTDPTAEPDRAPLELVQCAECHLVQLRHTVDRDRLYRTYWYRSATNESMVRALKDVVDDACRRVSLGPGDTVLDIGANDGTLLKCYGEGIRRIGVDPSGTFARDFSWMRAGDGWWTTYFPVPDWARPEISKVITSIAMFYDLDDPNAFVAAIKDWMHPDGVWILQMPDLMQMLMRNAFDNICHEHLTYWPYFALEKLLARHGLQIVEVIPNDVNGGSYRYIVKHDKEGWTKVSHRPFSGNLVQRLYQFADDVRSLRERTLALCQDLKRQGKTIYGYGASTKGNTLLQYYGLDSSIITAIADRNLEKHGRYTVGTNIPIVSEDEMRAARPDYLFILPWHFLDGFRTRERDFLRRGGQFIIPLPELRVEGIEDASLLTKDLTPVTGA